MENKLILTESILHEGFVDSIHVKEGFFADGRSYVSELWSVDDMTSVTYYFAVEGIEPSEKSVEQYLISVGKLEEKEEHPYIGIGILDIQGIPVYSVTVTVGIEDECFCEAYL